MSTYAKLDSEGYVAQIVSGDKTDDELVPFDAEVLESRPSPYHKYHLARQVWEDTRSVGLKEISARSAAIAERNALLASSDWTQLPDNPLSSEKQSEWAVYRQALRDITTQASYPLEITWPTTPL
jgi:hypothetical protein